ncbi:YchJ family protein [Luteimonas sp. A478]
MAAAADLRGPCPCGAGRDYLRCCAPLHQGQPAADAAALMRSRYSAYVLLLEDYLRQSWHPDTCPDPLDLEAPAEGGPTWLGLTVKSHRLTGEDSAIVEFIARYREGGASAVRMQEASRFLRVDGRWLYLDAGG